METKSTTANTSSSIFLTGAIFLANLDFVGLLDYAVKAAVGGAIWLGYKLTADYIDRKRKNK
jgi:hypothetical protein